MFGTVGHIRHNSASYIAQMAQHQITSDWDIQMSNFGNILCVCVHIIFLNLCWPIDTEASRQMAGPEMDSNQTFPQNKNKYIK